MEWSSKAFYENALQADKSVADHTTNDLCDFKQDSPCIMLYIDTAGCDMFEAE